MAEAVVAGVRLSHPDRLITPSIDWSECLAFSRDVADAFARTDPDRYTTKFSKRGREQKILIDYLRNNRTNTSVCAYSPRARAERRCRCRSTGASSRASPIAGRS